MNNSRTMGTYILAGMGIGALIWANKDSILNTVDTLKNKMTASKAPANLPIEKAGLSDPHDIDDNKMVSEGSMYGVHYYNQNEQDA